MKKQLLKEIIEKKEKKIEFAIITDLENGESCVFEKEKPIDKNRNTIRISNISDNADEQDIRELFYNYGRITRLYYNQTGFAFLTYSELNGCEKAIEAVNGHPYDYLILSVEMAKSKV